MGSETRPINSVEDTESLARRIVEAGLEVPAVFFLELQKPVSGIIHTGVLFAEPLLGPLFGTERIKNLEHLFASREKIEALILQIEHFANRKESAK